MTPAHVETRYLNLLASIAPRSRCSINTLRERIEAAQLSTFEHGELWRYGVRNGYLTALMLWEPSTAPAAKRRYCRCYRRTTKVIGRAA